MIRGVHNKIVASSASVHTNSNYAVWTLILAFLAYLSYQIDYLFNVTMLRILYSVFMYSSVVLIMYVFLSTGNRKKLAEDPKYGLYFLGVMIFIFYNVGRDFSNPRFSAVTLFNNSNALAAIIPVFGLIVGINTTDPAPIRKLLQIGALLVGLYAVYTVFKPEFAPKVFTALVLAFAVFALTEKKYLHTILLFGVAAVHSFLVDYRVLLLSMLVFSVLYALLNITRKSTLLKWTIVVTAAVAMYFIITDLDAILQIFQSTKSLGKTSTNTRTFLYEEIFSDLPSQERVTGRGFLGTYFSPYFYKIRESGIPEYYIRFTVEVAFLELLLKGGYIYVTLYFLPIVYVALNAISLKKDHLLLTYNIGIYLFTELFICFFENIPEYSIHNFLIFVLAGYAYTQIRIEKKARFINTLKRKRTFEV